MKERSRLIAVGAAIVVVLLGVYLFLVSPRRGEVNTVRGQVAAARSTTAGLQLELERLQALQDNQGALESELAQILELVPRKNQVPEFMIQVEAAADEAGVDFVEIQPELPKQPPEGATLAQVRVAISSSGSYFSVQDFLRRLYELDRAVRIDLVTMDGTTESGETTIDLAITARIFFELPAGGATGAAPTTPSTPDTTGTPAPAATPGTTGSPAVSNTENPAT
jgi:Tfp pilus assembly protein PilO